MFSKLYALLKARSRHARELHDEERAAAISKRLHELLETGRKPVEKAMADDPDDSEPDEQNRYKPGA
jgi:hypothetical protein